MAVTGALEGRSRWFGLVVLCLGYLMIVLDATIVNVALPSIGADLDISGASLAWVVNAYLLTFGGFLLLGGRLGDLFGQRRLFLLGIALFTLASLACGIANSQGLLVAARAVQGLGGAIVAAVALSLIMIMFTDPGERAKAMGVVGFVASGGGTVGVVAGGVLTDSLNWHWIFLVNLPIGVAVYALCVALLPGDERSRADRPNRLRGRLHGDGVAHARGVRDRERERRGMDVCPDSRAARRRSDFPGDLHRRRVARSLAARAPRAVQAPQPRHRERRRTADRCRDVRVVLPRRALPRATSSTTARSRSGSRSCRRR